MIAINNILKSKTQPNNLTTYKTSKKITKRKMTKKIKSLNLNRPNKNKNLRKQKLLRKVKL